MSNINSFAENMNKIVENTNNQISLLNGMQETLTTDADTVSVTVTDTDGSTNSESIPSWRYMTDKLTAVANSVNSLLEGKGVVSVGDGTSRTVEMTNIASVPDQITGLATPTTFSIDPNWWFEDFMYPSAQVTVSLLGKIDDSADRIKVKRVILDWTDSNVQSFRSSGSYDPSTDYDTLVSTLTNAGLSYSEDDEIISLPLANADYYGKFNVSKISYSGSDEWWVLDTLQYRYTKTANASYSTSVMQLKVGDQLCQNNYLYTVTAVNTSENKIQLKCTIGYSLPASGSVLRFYNEPWSTKNVNVKFGSDELDYIFFKGIDENFNIIADEWSEPVIFITNDLIYSGDNATTFSSYYASSIVDWGKNMIAEAKEKKVLAVNGLTPNAPSISADNFSVVQINTQVNASLDSDEILKQKASIETTKSRLTTLKATIDQEQTVKQTTTDATEYNKLTTQLNQNISEYKQLQTSYQTSLSTMQTLLQENNAVDVSPKYHIRGFFGIPDAKVSNGVEQQIVGFEIAYRYIKQDSTGVDLKTYTYTSGDGATHTGTYSDWSIDKTAVLNRQINSTTGVMEWVSGNISDATEININQVDIPITKGEEVEFKIRSISEAGYPDWPLKSDWSASVTMDFPSNLLTASSIENLITDINDENVQLTVENTLTSEGLLTHIDDSATDVNSVNGTYFKHKAENISYEFTDPTTGSITTISLQTALDRVFDFISAFMKYSDEIIPDSSSLYSSDNYFSIKSLAYDKPFEYGATSYTSITWTYSSDVTISTLSLSSPAASCTTTPTTTATSAMMKATSPTADTTVTLQTTANGYVASRTITVPVLKKFFYGASATDIVDGYTGSDTDIETMFRGNDFSSSWCQASSFDETVKINVPATGGYWYIAIPTSIADKVSILENTFETDVCMTKTFTMASGVQYTVIAPVTASDGNITEYEDETFSLTLSYKI